MAQEKVCQGVSYYTHFSVVSELILNGKAGKLRVSWEKKVSILKSCVTPRFENLGLAQSLTAELSVSGYKEHIV